MYQAVVAHYFTTGKKSFLNIALKNADLVCSVFGPDKKHSILRMGKQGQRGNYGLVSAKS
jgi:DUF1680 family protein